MQKSVTGIRWGRVLAISCALALLWSVRFFVWQAAVQLFYGMLAALFALPVMRLMEKRLSPAPAASLSMLALGAALLGTLTLIIPLVIAQARQLASALPGIINQAKDAMRGIEGFLADNGLTSGESVAFPLIENAQGLLEGALPGLIVRAGGSISGLSKVMVAPVFAFYFLRDRRRICAFLLMLVPLGWRDTAVRALREMRREMAGFIRGQLMVSAAVMVLTSAGLLLCGVPAWLLLGLMMGVLELIPYVGPIIGGVFVFFFALPGGLMRVVWAMAVVLLVQQMEGGMLSPQLMSGATQLHPVWVLLCVMLGGMAGGVMGILVSVPLMLCLRAVSRVMLLRSDVRRRK